MNIFMLVGKGIIAPHIIEDVALALRQNGCQVRFVSLVATEAEVVALCKEAPPDIIFSLDGKGLFSEALRSVAVPRVPWFVDNPAYFDVVKDFAADDVLFVWDKDYVADLTAAGFKQVHYLPLATNPDRFHDRALSAAEQEQFGCEVGFVGTVGERADVLRARRRQEYPERINTCVDAMIPVTQATYVPALSAEARRVLWSALRGMPPDISRFVQLLVDQEVNAIRRHEIARLLGDYNAYLYGDEYLKEYSNGGARYRGVGDYARDVRTIYAASSIILNVTRPQLRSTVNQRFFDVFSCGGFLLTDYQPDIELFAPRHFERICFSSINDLHDKIRYYLRHPEERLAISRELKEQIRLRHTYRCRVEEMVAILQRTVQI